MTAPGKRPPKAEVDARIAQVRNWLATGHTSPEIQDLAKQKWGVSKTTACRYIKEARTVLMDAVNIDRKVYASEHLATLHRILREALACRNYNACLGATAQLARLTGIEANSK